MSPKTSNTMAGVLAIAVVLVAIVVGVVALIRTDPLREESDAASDRFEYDLDKYMEVDPALIRYSQTGQIDPAMKLPRAVAVGSDDRVYVAGDELIRVFDSAGTEVLQIALEGRPQCLTVAGDDHAFPGRVYVGMREHIEVYSPDGARQAVWQGLGGRAVLTSIATDHENVFLADAGNKIVLRCDTDGQVVGRIGKRDPAKNIPGFVIPSPYFDILMAPDGLLRVVNPGKHQIEAYTVRGDLELTWGKPTLAIEGFSGCCNPVNLTVLPDGRFVTAEKGIPRVKIYSAAGRFECVVASPAMLLSTTAIVDETRESHKLLVVDLATDSRGRILILDPTARALRVFERNRSNHEH